MRPFQLNRDAARDLEEAVAYLAQDSEHATLSLVDDLENGFRFPAQWPLTGHRRPDIIRSHLRFWTVAGYAIAYQPTPKPPTIVAVLHGSRDIHSVLKDRF